MTMWLLLHIGLAGTAVIYLSINRQKNKSDLESDLSMQFYMKQILSQYELANDEREAAEAFEDYENKVIQDANRIKSLRRKGETIVRRVNEQDAVVEAVLVARDQGWLTKQ